MLRGNEASCFEPERDLWQLLNFLQGFPSCHSVTLILEFCMKIYPSAIAICFFMSLASASQAQVIIQQKGHRKVIRSNATTQVNPSLSALQTDLISAITAMKAALPIYDGNRVRSIHAAHNALVIVDHALLGAKASFRAKPMVNDNVRFKTAHSRYSSDQIAASQSQMQSGLSYLQSAWKDLQNAVGANPNTSGLKVGDDLQTAAAEATAAIALHANKP